MPKMDDEKLLSHLQALEDDSSAFTHGKLGSEREKSMREYFRMPYGNEEDGLSQIVTSEVQDAIEWMMPDLLDIFTSSDKAVVFDPTKAEDVKGAKQATDAVNYVFYKQNNGFLTLYTAFKDALLVKNCAVMWRKETKRTREVIPAKGASAEMLAMILRDAGDEAQIESSKPLPQQPMLGPDGQPVLDMTGQAVLGPQLYDARITSYKKKTRVKVEAFAPETLAVKRDWTTPLLDDCPYVRRDMMVSLSELHEMGFTEVTAQDLSSSDESAPSADAMFRANRAGTIAEIVGYNPSLDAEDESRTQGYLRIEFVLVDYDGDGISERRCIYRLKDKILSNEECAQVPIATASPILIAHRWDGMSLAETVSDLQELKTELTRQMVDSGRLALNPRMKVLTDVNGSPLANIDDLLDSRAGGLIRQSRVDATQEQITPWVGGQMFPMLEYVDSMGEKRTGISRVQQGIDPNILKTNRTLGEARQTAQTAKQRIKLVARIFGEVLLKPTFLGILRLLTEGGMDKIAFRLNDEFVEIDPNEWHDGYDMSVNVGLGTGDKENQMMLLQGINNAQMGLANSPFGPLLLTPKNIYSTQAKMIEAAGYKNPGDFYQDPGEKQIPPPQAPPDPQIQIKQMELTADAQKFQVQSRQNMELEQMKAAAKLQDTQAQLELQASNDQRDSERETLKANHVAQIAGLNAELARYKVDQDNAARVLVAQIGAQSKIPVVPSDEASEGEPDHMALLSNAIAMLAEAHTRPKTATLPNGKTITIG
jgi:hypothetical protein